MCRTSLWNGGLKQCEPETPMISRPTIYNLKSLQIAGISAPPAGWLEVGAKTAYTD